MSFYNLEDLEIYRMAENFADTIWTIVTKWDLFVKDTVGKQLVRSADFISANIAEGYGRYDYKERRNFCFFSRGSIMETKGWLKKSKNRELLTTDEFNSLFDTLQTIHLKLNAYIKFIGKTSSNKQYQ